MCIQSVRTEHQVTHIHIDEIDISIIFFRFLSLFFSLFFRFYSLRNLYYEENTTINKVNYGLFTFSMNNGDYKKPIN